MNFLSKIDYLMERDGLNKNSLSIRSGVPYTTIDALYKKGFQNAKMGTIRKLADAFDVTLDYLMVDSITDENYGKSDGFKVDYDEMIHIKKLRKLDTHGKGAVNAILDYEVARLSAQQDSSAKNVIDMIVYTYPAAAGVPLYAEDDYERIEFPASAVPKGADFGIKISGDSMEPTIPDGTIVFVRKTPELSNGQIGIFMIDDSAVCKRYTKRGKEITLLSDNPAYDPIVIHDYESFGIVGKVLEYK